MDIIDALLVFLLLCLAIICVVHAIVLVCMKED